MNRPMLAVTIVLAVALVAVAVWPPASRAAEEAQPDPSVTAVMRIDMAPVLEQLAAMRQEVAQMREAVLVMQKSAEEVQIMSVESVGLLHKLSPERWDYKLVRKINERDAQAEGEKGWEMVTVTPQGWMFFRRPVVEEENLEKLK